MKSIAELIKEAEEFNGEDWSGVDVFTDAYRHGQYHVDRISWPDLVEDLEEETPLALAQKVIRTLVGGIGAAEGPDMDLLMSFHEACAEWSQASGPPERILAILREVKDLALRAACDGPHPAGLWIQTMLELSLVHCSALRSASMGWGEEWGAYQRAIDKMASHGIR